MVSRTGEASLQDSDIPALAAKYPDGSFATKDLVDAINNGTFPQWDLYIQTLDPSDVGKYDFDPIDPTKARHALDSSAQASEPSCLLPLATCHPHDIHSLCS